MIMIFVSYFWWRDNIQTQFSVFYNEGIVSMMTRKYSFAMCTSEDKSPMLKQKCEHSTQNGTKHTPVCFESIVSETHGRKWQKISIAWHSKYHFLAIASYKVLLL